MSRQVSMRTRGDRNTYSDAMIGYAYEPVSIQSPNLNVDEVEHKAQSLENLSKRGRGLAERRHTHPKQAVQRTRFHEQEEHPFHASLASPKADSILVAAVQARRIIGD